jgi:hypothetical protein
MPAIQGGEGVFIPFGSKLEENVVPGVFRNAAISWRDVSTVLRAQFVLLVFPGAE